MALVSTTTHEGTTVGAEVPTGGAVDFVLQPAVYGSRAAHGTRGVTFASASPPGYVRLTLPTTDAYTVSHYVYIEATASGAALPFVFIDASGSRQATVRFHPDGRFDIGNASNLRQAVGAGTYAAGEWMRLDVTITEASGFTTVAVKAYRPAELSTPVSDFGATFATSSPIVGMQYGAHLNGWSLSFDTLRIYDTPTDVAAYDPAPEPDPDPEPEPDPEYVNGVAVHDFEEGFNGANIPPGENGVTAVSSPPPVYTGDNQIAGNFSAFIPDVSPAAWLEYNVPNTGAFSTTVSVRPVIHGTNGAQIVRVHDTGGTMIAAVRLHPNGVFDIANQSTLRQVASVARWTLGEIYRLDVRVTVASELYTVTVRIYERAGTQAVDEISTTLPYPGLPGVLRYGTAGATWAVQIDNIRRYQEPTWTGTGPPEFPGTVHHAWVGGHTATSFQVKAKVSGTELVGLRYSLDESMSGAVTLPELAVTPSGYAPFTVENLTPGGEYYYQFYDGTGPIGAVGRVRLLPPAGMPADFTVALAACTLKGQLDGRAHQDLHAWDPNFLIHTGDFYYTSSQTDDPAFYQGLYDDMISTYPGHGALMRDIPSYYCASDHEAGLDNGDSNNAWTVAHITAYDRVVPHRVADTRVPMRARYQSWVAGRVRFIMTDVRNLDRSPGLMDDGPTKTMLGATQMSWLKSELMRPEPLKIIITDPGWMGPYTLTEGEDKWWAYARERQEIIDFVTANELQVEVWHGDSHTLGIRGKTNPYGNFAVLCSAPLAQTGGGRMLTHFDQAWNNNYAQARQYMRITFTDSGDTITRTAEGYDATSDVIRVASTETYHGIEVPPPGGAFAIWDGSSLVPATSVDVWDGETLTPVTAHEMR